jgi:7,8-dihydro-6-hydroxymethylpterin dimethyltransferase
VLTLAELGLALLKNFDAKKAPVSFPTLMKQFLSQTGARGKKIGEFESDAHEFEWRILFVAGMWFQDLFNYDFRRTEMCIIPYGTQMGEISFCAYNTGVGWRQVIEKMKMTATVADWYRDKGRHPVYAKGQDLPLPPKTKNRRLPVLET